MNGDQLMAKLLKKEGTEWISCFPAQTLIEACSQEGIRPYLCRQERAGVNMADAYSRIHNGNKIGVFTMQHGPGAENAFGGVAQAFADNVPVLLIPGGSTSDRVGVHPGFDAFPNYQLACSMYWSYVCAHHPSLDNEAPHPYLQPPSRNNPSGFHFHYLYSLSLIHI